MVNLMPYVFYAPTYIYTNIYTYIHTHIRHTSCMYLLGTEPLSPTERNWGLPLGSPVENTLTA